MKTNTLKYLGIILAIISLLSISAYSQNTESISIKLGGAMLTENEQGIVGISIYYWRYSTWKGKRLYLEDIVVTESERGQGAGKMLFDRVMGKSLEANCTGMMWQVLDWNQPAINFYNKYGATLEAGWLNAHLQDYEIRKLLDV